MNAKLCRRALPRLGGFLIARSIWQLQLLIDEGLFLDLGRLRSGNAGQKLEVDYINAGPVSLAVFVRNGELVVASNVLSGSGARYAGGKYIWWTKGADGSLYDLTQGEDADPVLECSEVKNTKP